MTYATQMLSAPASGTLGTCKGVLIVARVKPVGAAVNIETCRIVCVLPILVIIRFDGNHFFFFEWISVLLGINPEEPLLSLCTGYRKTSTTKCHEEKGTYTQYDQFTSSGPPQVRSMLVSERESAGCIMHGIRHFVMGIELFNAAPCHQWQWQKWRCLRRR